MDWEKIDDHSDRLKVDGGYLYRTWEYETKIYRPGFFVDGYKIKEARNIQTIFVPDKGV